MRNYVLIGVFMIFALGGSSCSSESNAGESSESTTKSVPVRTVILEPQSFSNYLKVTGTVEARNHVQIMVEEAGTLERVLIEQGKYARAGEVLARLNNEVLEAQYQQAGAALHQAELNHSSRKVLYEKRAISENEYLNAKFSLDAAEAAYNLIRARVGKLSIKAPLNGLVNERYYDIGAYANPMTPIFEFIDNEVMKIRAGVAERFMSDISIGTPVQISFDAYPDLNIDAKITYVSRSITALNRTFTIEVAVPNPQHKLAPAMIANLRILREAHFNQIVVPLDALVESEKGWYVLVKEGESARRIYVQQEAIYEDNVMVHGLSRGQELITVGHRDLSDGDAVTVVE